MKASVDFNINAAEDVKQILNNYNNIQKSKLEYQKQLSEEDDNKLCFRICTPSGTRINIPPRILRDALIAGGIVATSKIIIDIISIIQMKNK